MKKQKATLLLIVFLLALASAQSQEVFDAIRSNDISKVKELVGNDPQMVYSRNARQSTPLHLAAADTFYTNREGILIRILIVPGDWKLDCQKEGYKNAGTDQIFVEIGAYVKINYFIYLQ